MKVQEVVPVAIGSNSRTSCMGSKRETTRAFRSKLSSETPGLERRPAEESQQLHCHRPCPLPEEPAGNSDRRLRASDCLSVGQGWHRVVLRCSLSRVALFVGSRPAVDAEARCTGTVGIHMETQQKAPNTRCTPFRSLHAPSRQASSRGPKT